MFRFCNGMHEAASAPIKRIVSAGCWKWNKDCQRYIPNRAKKLNIYIQTQKMITLTELDFGSSVRITMME